MESTKCLTNLSIAKNYLTDDAVVDLSPPTDTLPTSSYSRIALNLNGNCLTSKGLCRVLEAFGHRLHSLSCSNENLWKELERKRDVDCGDVDGPQSSVVELVCALDKFRLGEVRLPHVGANGVDHLEAAFANANGRLKIELKDGKVVGIYTLIRPCESFY
jgi:hypothetical protein